MKRALVIFLLSAAGTASAQLQKGAIDPHKIPEVKQHYQQEYTLDSPSQPGRWNGVRKGLNISFATTDELFLRTEVPALSHSVMEWEETGWRGERLSAQVLVWSPDTLTQVRFRASDLLAAGKKPISNSNVKINMVRYVVSNFPYGATAEECGSGSPDSAYLMPDRFEAFDRFDLPGRTLRPVWISVDIPRDAEPGTYLGTISASTERENVFLKYKIKVQAPVLPKPKEWKYRLDLWQNPWVVAWYYHVEPWSEEHKMLLKKHLSLYADAGGKYITTYAVHSPWSDNSYMIEGGMIEWIRKTTGVWNFDYTIFDTYVQLAMDAGIDQAITIYTPVPWGYRFRYLDERTNNYVEASWAPETEDFKSVWNTFLTDLKAHLQQKGWFGKTYLGINENPLDVTRTTIEVIRNHSKDWRITYAGDWHAEITDLLDDYSTVLGKEPNLEELRLRKSKGLTTTFYVCCTPARPNNFVFSPPVEGEYLGWYAAAFGYDGFLRWAYDAWPADPLRDARHTFWPAGDCFLVYPGGGSSIRYEKMREGIVGFEKIRILRELAAKSSNKKVKAAMAEFEEHLASLAGNHRPQRAAEMAEALRKGEIMIDNLSEMM